MELGLTGLSLSQLVPHPVPLQSSTRQRQQRCVDLATSTTTSTLAKARRLSTSRNQGDNTERWDPAKAGQRLIQLAVGRHPHQQPSHATASLPSLAGTLLSSPVPSSSSQDLVDPSLVEHLLPHCLTIAQALVDALPYAATRPLHLADTSSPPPSPPARLQPLSPPSERILIPTREPQYRPNMSQLTDDANVVVGRGKSGWNKLLGKPPTAPQASTNSEQASARSSSSTTTPTLLTTSVSAAATSLNSASNSEGGDAHIHSEASAPERNLACGRGRSDEESLPQEACDEEDDDDGEHVTHGMFHGAGKFLLAGGIAGAVSRTATAPFDRLKVYLITSQDRPPPNPNAPPPPTPSGADSRLKKPRRSAGRLPAAVKALWKQGGGPRAFWTGNGLNIVKIFPESAIKFLSYESAKRVFAQYWDKVPDQSLISNSSRFVSGGVGGVVSQFVIYPIETLKTRVMSSTGGELEGNALILKTASGMWKRGGIRVFFKGLPAGLIGVFPYSAIDMSTYEGIKIAYAKWSGHAPEFPGTLVFGAFSGGIGATSVYPLNLVRTRLQAQGTPAHPQTYNGVRDAAMQCFVREGWRGFYKGLTPTLVKVIPAVSISYAVYEKSKKILFAMDAPEPLERDDVEES